MIRGYPARASVAPGEHLVLHIATDARRFRICYYRWWDGPELMHRSAWMAGADAPEGKAEDDWRWPAYAFDIPREWRSAVYIAHLEEEGGPGFDLALQSAALLFVVRGAGHAKLLYKIPLATYQAYNHTGGACFYHHPPRSREPEGARVSILRPGGGIGGITWGAADYYDQSSPRQTFAHWDAPFIRWLALQGYEAEFCTDLDIHADSSLCGRYRVVLSAGHDEYWSEATRKHLEAHIANGGNVAFFAANLCWWRIHVVEDGAAMVCHQGGPHGARDHWWPVTGVGRPEDTLAGVSYRHGGGWWDGPRQAGAYIVQHGAHWVFVGTGLRDGDAFGLNTSPPLVGYECDGAPLVRAGRFAGALDLAPGATGGGTPRTFTVLAAAELGPEWQELPPREGRAAAEGIHAATMGIYEANGTVFTAGTTDWAQVLASAQDSRVERITRNVLNRLLQT